MNLNWMACSRGVYCSLFKLNLASITARHGVYVIWQEVDSIPVAIHVGQVSDWDRSFSDRFGEHRADAMMKEYQEQGNLLVTWAHVPDRRYIDGIERFLFEVLVPLEGERTPNVDPIAVNLPPRFTIE